MTRIKLQRREVRYVSVLTVHALSGNGLIEGMRYDRCCPYNESESHKISRLVLGRSASDDDRIIALLRFSSSPTPATAQRWRSFSCTVIDERDPEAGLLLLDDARKMLAEARERAEQDTASR